MTSLFTDGKAPSAALLGGRTKAEIIRVLLLVPRLSISELARRAQTSKSATRQALPSLEQAGVIVISAVGNEHQVELAPGARSLAESIMALDNPTLPVAKEAMTDADWDRVALYFAAPSSALARTDDWADDQRALPVSSGAWEGRPALD